MDSSNVIAGRYELVRLIGSGGMGEVHEAIDRETGRKVAVKQLRLGRGADELTARFRREILAMAQVTSKHVIAIHDAGVENGEPYLVMEYLEGEDLATIADRLGVLPVELAVRVAAQACDGVVAVHAAGIVHRDIKPSNLFLLAPNAQGSRILKILDFGIARVRTSAHVTELTQTGAIVGSPLYMAPEQLRGVKDVDHRADVWSLGVLLYRLLCGDVPHSRSTVADQLITVCSEPAPPLRQRAPWVPAELAAIVHRALMIDVDRRTQTARELAGGLAGWLQGGSTITDAMLVGRSPSALRPTGVAVSPSAVMAHSATVLAAPPQQAPAGPRRSYVVALGVTVAVAGAGLALRFAKHPASDRREDDDAVAPAPLIGDMAPNLANTPGAAWFARVRPRCTALELRSALAEMPPPKTPDGVAFATACAALGGDLQLARSMLFELDAGDRAYGAGAMFELAHEMADRRNADPMVAEIMRLVLEVWPDNYQAQYAAGVAEFQAGDARASGHLRAFVRQYPNADGFAHTAMQLLEVLAAPAAACGRKLRDPMGHPIVIPGC